MDYKADEFRNVALLNKPDLRKKTVIIPISDNNYQFKISGIGQKAIKLEKYFYYSEIIDAVQEGIDDGLEFLIEQVIIDPKKEKRPNLDCSSELKLRANANKQALKRMTVEEFVGTKKYEFRIAGIGGRSIKLEIYVGYEDIAKELNNGNTINLEFILKEVLVGNKVDYTIFEDIDIEDYQYDDEDDDVEDDEILEDIPVKIDKLSSSESKELISQIEGIQRLIFDSIDDIDSDVFTVEDVLEQDRIKAYAVQGKSFEPIIIKNIDELIDLGIIAKGNNNDYHKLW